MAEPRQQVPRIGAGRGVLVVVAHADDPTLFIGGSIAQWAASGARVTVVRATNDALDSVGLDRDTTIEANTTQFATAMRILGVAETVDLGWETDRLADASEVALRERIIFHIRRLRPFALVTFDPYAAFGEDNQDHMVVGRAVDEAAWTAAFDKHHPEHFAAGLAPHAVYERRYFGRRVVEVTEAVDVATTIDRKVEAALAHDVMIRHLIHQSRMQASSGGYEVPALEAAAHGDLRPLVTSWLRDAAAAAGRRHGLDYAEEFRVARPHHLEALAGVP